MSKQVLFPVIMAGGSGTRFWPLSRRRTPKQFLPLVSSKPLLVDTFERVRPLASPEQSFVVCGKLHAAPTRRLLPELPRRNVLVEPCPRNTAPCIGLAALAVAAQDPQGIMAVLPSDHAVAELPAFRAALQAAAEAARDGSLVTLGMKPTRPETGYGYIQVGERRSQEGAAVHRVARFVEKPTLEKAQALVAQGDHLWNAGIFVFRADAILEAIARHLPELHRGLEELRPLYGTRRWDEALARVFPSLPSISIDYGIMERAERIAVVPSDFGWSDVGSFAALPEVRPADGSGNVVEGDTLLIDSTGCVVLGRKRPILLVGMHDLVVVDAGDALLVCPKSRTQDVKKAVEELERRGRAELL